MITGHVFIATSLDGFIARAGGGIDWLLARDDPAEDHGHAAFLADKDGVVMGRGSYEAALGMDPWPYDRPVVVLSATLAPARVPVRLGERVRVIDAPPGRRWRGWRRRAGAGSGSTAAGSCSPSCARG